MPMNLLRRLADVSLPCNVDDERDVSALRILMIAGHIVALIPTQPAMRASNAAPHATLLSITSQGRQMLAICSPD